MVIFFSSVTTLDWIALNVGCTDAMCSCSEVMKASSLGGDADGLVSLMWQFWSDGSGTEDVGRWDLQMKVACKQVMKVYMTDHTGQVYWLDCEQEMLTFLQ